LSRRKIGFVLQKAGPICRTFSTVVEEVINRRDRKDRGEDEIVFLCWAMIYTPFSLRVPSTSLRTASAFSVVKNSGLCSFSFYPCSHPLICLPRSGLCLLFTPDKLSSVPSAALRTSFCRLSSVFYLLCAVSSILYSTLIVRCVLYKHFAEMQEKSAYFGKIAGSICV